MCVRGGGGGARDPGAAEARGARTGGERGAAGGCGSPGLVFGHVLARAGAPSGAMSVSEVAIDALCESLSHKTKVGGGAGAGAGAGRARNLRNLRVDVGRRGGGPSPEAMMIPSSRREGERVSEDGSNSSSSAASPPSLPSKRAGPASSSPCSHSPNPCSPVNDIPVNARGLYSNLERFIVEATPVLAAQCAGDGMMTMSPDGSASSLTSEAAEALEQGAFPPLRRAGSGGRGIAREDPREDAASHAMEMDGSGSEGSSSKRSSSEGSRLSRSPSMMRRAGDTSILLGDLWEAYREWSAFGMAVPLTLLDGSECEQCFIPYLSSLHIYEGRGRGRRRTTSATPSDNSEMDEDGESEMSDSCSMTSCSTSTHGSTEDSASLTQHWAAKGEVLVPRFQYAETAQPGARIPLYEKLRQLQLEGPVDIFNLRTDDIHSMSWMAIAWYPICTIPASNLKASTSFLTFHSLHVGDKSANLPVFFRKDLAPEGPPLSPRAAQGLHERVSAWRDAHAGGEGDVVALRCFGCASYKMASALWLGKDGEGRDLSIQLHSATSFWLKRVKAKQHDHAFFTRKLARCSSGGSSDGERGRRPL